MNERTNRNDDDQPTPRKGPWHHRLMVWLFGVALGVLVFWLLGFIVHDIGTWPGPQFEEVAQEVLDEQLLARHDDLEGKLETVNDDIEAKQERQADLRDSTDSAEKTMNRLLDIQRLALEKDKDLSDQEKQSLADAKDLFLSNQKKYQSINEELVSLKQQRQTLQEDLEQVREKLDGQREEARETWQARREMHEIKLAAIKLGVLTPLLILAALAYWKWRASLYVPLLYAAGIAIAARVGFVMHDHFPTRYFKYVLIVVAIAIVVCVLIWLLRRVARPGADWLLKQYREAYERFICPVCEYPIRRGPLRFRFWTRRSIKKLSLSADGLEAHDNEPYVCPDCSTSLYEKCDSCDRIRPTLMRACPHCGDAHSEGQIIEASGERVREAG